MNEPKRNNKEMELWKPLTFGLVGVVASVSISWFSLAGSIVDRRGIKEMIQREAPYVQDRLYIKETLKEIMVNVKWNRRLLSDIEKDVASLLPR